MISNDNDKETKININDIKVKISAAAVSGLVVGILALLLSAVPIINNFAAVLAIAAFILGILGIIRTKKSSRRGKGIAIAAVIVSVLSLAIVLISQQMYSSVLNSASDEFNKSMDRSTGKATNEILGKDVDVKIESFVVTPGEYSTDTKLPVKVTNKMSETTSFTIKIEAIDKDGTRIAEDTVYANDLGSKQTGAYDAFKYVESGKLDALKSATFKVATVSE